MTSCVCHSIHPPGSVVHPLRLRPRVSEGAGTVGPAEGSARSETDPRPALTSFGPPNTLCNSPELQDPTCRM